MININIEIRTNEDEATRYNQTNGYEAVINRNDTPFSATKHNFLGYFSGYSKFTYSEWMSLPRDDKSAALFLKFYDQITLAWYKSKSFYAEEEEAVETIMQYLEKNVPLLEAKESKFSPAYIYKVAYNCLYCISHDRKIDKDRWEKEVSNIQGVRNGSGEDSVDLFDICSNGNSCEEDIFKMAENQRFWRLIEDVDIDALDVAMKLINGESLGRSKMEKRRAAEIIEKLKVVLEEYRNIYFNS